MRAMRSARHFFRSLALTPLLAAIFAPAVHGATLPPTAPACAEAPAVKGRARERFESVVLMTIAKEVEGQGEANFHLRYAKPSALCLVETFSVGNTLIAAEHSPFVKGLSTLLYRFSIARPDGNSEVLVLYSGMAALIAGGGDHVFHVSEERQGVISWYAIYANEPGYEHAKALAERIVRGQARPLMAVTWPKGAREGAVVDFDAARLK